MPEVRVCTGSQCSVAADDELRFGALLFLIRAPRLEDVKNLHAVVRRVEVRPHVLKVKRDEVNIFSRVMHAQDSK